MEDYRPIALSNSVYLILAKTLANRMGEVIGEVVGTFQSAFIPRRQLINSVVMVGEIVASWQRKGTKGFMWKVDLAKAYDTISWKFLWASMRKCGFPKKWVTWVRCCITSHTFLVLVMAALRVDEYDLNEAFVRGCPLFVLGVGVDSLASPSLCAGGGFLSHLHIASRPEWAAERISDAKQHQRHSSASICR